MIPKKPESKADSAAEETGDQEKKQVDDYVVASRTESKALRLIISGFKKTRFRDLDTMTQNVMRCFFVFVSSTMALLVILLLRDSIQEGVELFSSVAEGVIFTGVIMIWLYVHSRTLFRTESYAFLFGTIASLSALVGVPEWLIISVSGLLVFWLTNTVQIIYKESKKKKLSKIPWGSPGLAG